MQSLKQMLLTKQELSYEDIEVVQKDFEEENFLNEIISSDLKYLVTDAGSIDIDNIFDIEKRKNILGVFDRLNKCIFDMNDVHYDLDQIKSHTAFIKKIMNILLDAEVLVAQSLITRENNSFLNQIDRRNSYMQALHELKILPYKHVIELSLLDREFLNERNVIESQNLQEKKNKLILKHKKEENRVQRNVAFESTSTEKEYVIKELDEQYEEMCFGEGKLI